MATLTKDLPGFIKDRNTLVKAVKPNSEDRIEIEIGDSKQEDFKPQYKISRWDNDVNFSIRAEEDSTATADIEDGIVKYKSKDFEVHMYEKPEVGEEGGFEFEWVLPKKPDSNVLTATIQTKGLVFYYQPALTSEEVEQGAERPENVVGSYAVYHSSKRDNRLGDKNYKTGKAFHIYRPKAIDDDGAEVWCELNIDEQTGLLTVTVPQDWLNKAKYPVKVDPTFGYTSIGGTFAATGGVTMYSQATPASAGDVTKLTFYCDWNNAGSGNFPTAIYSDDTGDPDSRLATAANVNKPNGAAWEDASVSLAVTAIPYHFGFYSSSAAVRWYYDTGLGGVSNTDSVASSLPATATPAGTNTGRSWSIYATYTESGGATPTSSLMMMGVGS